MKEQVSTCVSNKYVQSWTAQKTTRVLTVCSRLDQVQFSLPGDPPGLMGEIRVYLWLSDGKWLATSRV